ncbi:MAG: hypothetical protein ACXW3O_05555 [Brevundimonas sp.]
MVVVNVRGVSKAVVRLRVRRGIVLPMIVVRSRRGVVVRSDDRSMIAMAMGIMRGRTVSGFRSGRVVIVVAVSVRRGRRGRVVMTMTGVVAVIVVRLLLVAHLESVPQPLPAVFAAKSV